MDTDTQTVYAAVRLALRDHAPPLPTVLTAADMELLLALSWAGPFTLAHLQQLVGHAFESGHMLQKRVLALDHAGLIAGRVLYKKPGDVPKTRTARRIGKFYTVTDRGRACIVGHDREPYRETAPRERQVLATHDRWVSTTLVFLIRQARPILSAVGAFREMRIDAEQTRPIADCVIWLRSYGKPVTEPVLHWSRQYCQPGEEIRLFAIEVDRGTEQLSVIRAKADSYRNTATNADFRAKYAGEMPVALWVAPSEARMQSIHAQWVNAWPDGTWWLTTDVDLPQDRFWEYADGVVRRRAFLDPAWAARVQFARHHREGHERMTP